MAPGLGVGAPELRREQDRVGDLVELQAGQCGEPSRLLFCGRQPSAACWRVPQVVERAPGRRAVAGRDLRGGHLVEVARPHEVVGPGVAGDASPTPTPSTATRCPRRGRSCPRGRRAPSPRRRRASVARGAARPVEPAEVGVPARGVAAGGGAKPPASAAPAVLAAAARGGAEAERERGAPVAALAGHRQLGDLGDVALGRRPRVAPVHPEVVAQVGPAVAPAQVAARHARRGGLARERRGELVVARDQRAPGGLADVVVAAVRQRRVEQRVELVGAPGERLEADVDRTAARRGSVT